jgi:gliding motility-associated-like protein
VGAIYVYTKKPGQQWTSRTESAKILPRVKDEGELFGYSLKVLGNTMIVGAPGADYLKTGAARNKPGRAYVFQSKDYFWQDVIPLVDFTGDSFIKDYYGMAVNLDESDFFMGAPIQDIESAKLSGAVYITPTPPIIMLVPPVCYTEEVVDLFGYPYGGTWTGPGIIDAAEGTFDPRVAGIGIHEFNYKTVSCHFEGRLRIQVEQPHEPILKNDTEILVCETATSIDIPLSVEPVPDGAYQWFYRESEQAAFLPIDEFQSSMHASKRGEYSVTVKTFACESPSAIVTIKNEELELSLQAVPRICQVYPNGIPLLAEPMGGNWQGVGVTNNMFLPGSVPNGTHTLTYTYYSPSACRYSSTIPVEVQMLPSPVIKREAGNLCTEGEVTLSTSTAFVDIQFDWRWKENDNGAFNSLSIDDKSITVSDRGIYQLMITDGECTASSNMLTISDSKFDIKMTPNEGSIKLCGGGTANLSVVDVPGRSYQWYFSASEDEQPSALSGEVASYINVEETGYYHVEITSGVCNSETPRKSVTVSPEDHMFIPNVFTPNGDGYNDVFKIESNLDEIQLYIINRYGQEVFSGNANSVWNGGGESSGVYFWNVLYKTCAGEHVKEKGTVHLTR